MVRYIRQKLQVQFLDVSAGGKVLAQLYHEKLIDEVRLTISGQIAGLFSSQGQERTKWFCPPEGYPAFTHVTSPLVHFKGIRAYGENHLFVRGAVEYRH
eukprot:JP439613.1.p1 GENE.JP439613.1~~JP439613.1.p1  ORF type:complete len:116 (+),score=2.85 JP439613.1:54-350(+)